MSMSYDRWFYGGLRATDVTNPSLVSLGLGKADEHRLHWLTAPSRQGEQANALLGAIKKAWPLLASRRVHLCEFEGPGSWYCQDRGTPEQPARRVTQVQGIPWSRVYTRVYPGLGYTRVPRIPGTQNC
jgi:hypothetical protein